ncbi:MAG: PAS domain-containing protein [Bacteroidia bacterium]
MEKALLKSERLLAQAEDITGIGSWEWDSVNDVAYWSDGLFKIFRLSPKKGAPSFAEQRSLYSKESYDRLNAAVQNSVEHGTPYEVEVQAICANGELRTCISRGRAEKNEKGLVTRLWGTFIDVTEQKKLEKDLNHALDAKDKFISILAHDLRSPFNAIMNLSEFLLEDVKNNDCEAVAQQAKMINKVSISTFELLENLLSWANIQRNTIRFQPVVLEVSDLIERSIHFLSQTAILKKQKIQFTNAKESKVLADRQMLETIFRNLISNAIKFTPKAGVIDVKYYSSNHKLLVEISDNGIGIKEDVVQNLFKPEFSHSTKGTEGEKGSGLGLVLVNEFVKKNGGTIKVNSEMQKGTTFSIAFPKLEVQ